MADEGDPAPPSGFVGQQFYSSELVWSVAPTPQHVDTALVAGPTTFRFRYEMRSKTNQFLGDMTPYVVAASIDLNNDREALRTATFTIDPTGRSARTGGHPPLQNIDPLSGHIGVTMELLVNGNWYENIPMGLFAMTMPRITESPRGVMWEIKATDNTVHLQDVTVTEPYIVAAGQNYISGTNGVREIFDNLGLLHNFPSTANVLDAARVYPPGTTYAKVVNDLLQGAGYYIHWFNRFGVATSRVIEDLSQRTPDVIYTGDDFVLPPLEVEFESARFANEVLITMEDPNRDPITAVATNNDPDSPISVVNLGRTYQKVIRLDSAANAAVLTERAQRELENAASMYERATLLTSIDPRRDAREVYEVTVGSYDQSRWQCRNWSLSLTTGAQMQHTISRVQRVVPDITVPVGGS